MRAALPRGLRMALLTAHITAGALWLGLDTALIAITAAHAAIPAAVSAAVLTSSAATTLGTGLVLAAHRPWGLRRHHWIVAKVRISAVVAAAGLTSVSGILDPLSVLAARVCALIALIAAIAVSVIKPWGLTEVGRAAAANRSARGAGQRTHQRPATATTSGENRNPANAQAIAEEHAAAALINQEHACVWESGLVSLRRLTRLIWLIGLPSVSPMPGETRVNSFPERSRPARAGDCS